jgi:hypothetical protein
MSEDEWDSVVRVHLKGHFAPRALRGELLARADEVGREINAAIVNTTSTSGCSRTRAGELRRGEVGDRHAHAGDGEGARALRRARERDRTGARAPG